MTSKENQPATPLPWHVGLRQAEQIVYDAKGWAVANATVYHGESDLAETKANARYIAHACNAYPRLVAAAQQMLAARDAVRVSVQHFHRNRTEVKNDTDAAKNLRAILRDLGEIK